MDKNTAHIKKLNRGSGGQNTGQCSLRRGRWPERLEIIRSLATELYFLLILSVFPLYLEHFYWDIGAAKWKYYLYVTLPYLAVMFFCRLSALPYAVKKLSAYWKQRGSVRSESVRPGSVRPKRGTLCDGFVSAYGICVLFTFGLQGFRKEAWTGADGWYMGAAAQLLFVLTYFAVSRSPISCRLLLLANTLGSGVCFLIGILQRLGWDILGLYSGMETGLLSDYLSTVGNRTWMSGYASAVFPLGVSLFWQSGWREDATNLRGAKGGRRVLWGLYSSLAFMGLAASYSDSSYIALGLVFFLLGVFSLGDGRKLLSFCQTLLVWFGSALFMCGLRALCGGRARDARGLTCYVYEWKWMLGGLALCAVMTVFVWLCLGQKQPSGAGTCRRLRTCGLIGGGMVCVLIVGFVVLNSAGVLEELFHVTIHNRYFYFDDAWGDGRGSTWKLTLHMFKNLPFTQKLFGVGADCFADYSYNIPQYAAQLVSVWEGLRLTNAHNEWLNMLFCQGIIGGSVYLGIFVSTVWTGIKKMDEGAVILPGLGLCAAAYMAHDFFCYQQICAAAPMFVLLGAFGSLLRGQEENLSDGEETDYGKENIGVPQIYG